MTARRFCAKCGRSSDAVPFQPRAVQCDDCAAKAEADRKGWHRRYQEARRAALVRLREAHREEYEALLAEERQKQGADPYPASPGDWDAD